MTLRIAINGYGRIGRMVLRALYEGPKKRDIKIVAINAMGNIETNAHLTQYDSAHGRFPGTVTVDGDYMVVNGDRITIRWRRLGGSWGSIWFWSVQASSLPRKRPWSTFSKAPKKY